MANRSSERLLGAAAARAADRSFFLASQLAAYRSLHSLTEADLAAWLGCRPDGLVTLALCRRPEIAASSFRAEVEKVAARARAKPERVAEALREVEAVIAFRQARSVQTGGMLLAARDRLEDAPQHPDHNKPKKGGRRRRRNND
jgi:hypothetical protein